MALHYYANDFTTTRTKAQLEPACETAVNENVIVDELYARHTKIWI
jgi:hypothetical protein